jgi:hypothetical protein
MPRIKPIMLFLISQLVTPINDAVPLQLFPVRKKVHGSRIVHDKTRKTSKPQTHNRRHWGIRKKQHTNRKASMEIFHPLCKMHRSSQNAQLCCRKPKQPKKNPRSIHRHMKLSYASFPIDRSSFRSHIAIIRAPHVISLCILSDNSLQLLPRRKVWPRHGVRLVAWASLGR